MCVRLSAADYCAYTCFYYISFENAGKDEEEEIQILYKVWKVIFGGFFHSVFVFLDLRIIRQKIN